MVRYSILYRCNQGSSYTLKALRRISPVAVKKIKSAFLSAMNGYLPGNFHNQSHHQINPHLALLAVTAGFPTIQSVHHSLTSLHPTTGFTTHPPAVPVLPLPTLHKSLNPHYVLQNFAFVNSEFYHQSSYSRPSSGDLLVAESGASGVDIEHHTERSDSTKENHINSTGSTPHSSRKSSPAVHSIKTSYPPVEEPDIMEARGIKRQRDFRHSPQRKRSRGYDDGGQGGSDASQYLDARNRSEMDAMTQYIWQHYEMRHQSKEVYNSKMRLREALYTLMKGVFPYCGVYIVGSSMNGFGAGTSDMDMCLMLSQAEINQKKEAPELLRILYKSLRCCNFLYNINLIRAKVPILKFTDRISNVEVDININNAVGIRNTHLLHAYSKMDWRVAPLVLFIKHWAKSQMINDASQGTISSYSLVLMAIHFLQIPYNGQPPVLPSLQQMYPNKFSSSVDIRLLTLNDKLPPYQSPNKSSLGQLFKGFLHYYATIFDFENEVISIRLATTIDKSTVVRSDATGNWKCLCIEEPFDLTNTARSVYDKFVFQRIYRVIRQSHERLRKTGRLDSIIHVPV